MNDDVINNVLIPLVTPQHTPEGLPVLVVMPDNGWTTARVDGSYWNGILRCAAEKLAADAYPYRNIGEVMEILLTDQTHVFEVVLADRGPR